MHPRIENQLAVTVHCAEMGDVESKSNLHVMYFFLHSELNCGLIGSEAGENKNIAWR